jgi:transposase
MERWESRGLRGLYDEPREGRPPIYNEAEVQRLQALLEQEPRSVKQAQARLIQETGKSASAKTLKRALKKKGCAGSAVANRYARSAMRRRSKRASSS